MSPSNSHGKNMAAKNFIVRHTRFLIGAAARSFKFPGRIHFVSKAVIHTPNYNYGNRTVKLFSNGVKSNRHRIILNHIVSYTYKIFIE
jgi:hypothetical protein